MANLSTRGIDNNLKEKGFFKSIFCYFFVYYGSCSFGQSCKFIHPKDGQLDWESMVATWNAFHNQQTPCKFFRFGVCKYGESCKFGHSEPIYEPNPWYHFNALGFPKRWGKPDCSYYMRTGGCGYGLACKFHHPEPVFYDPYQEHGAYVVNDGSYGERFDVRQPCVTLNNDGLPLRPRKRACRFYMNYKTCKYGRWCKFDHPLKRPSNEEEPSSHTLV